MCFGKYKKKNKRQKYKINKIVPLRENKSNRENYDHQNNHKEEHSIASNQRK